MMPLVLTTHPPGMAMLQGSSVQTLRGTIGYLPPELIALGRKVNQWHTVDFTIDTWGLGLITYTLLFGAHPWLRADDTDAHFTTFASGQHVSLYPWCLCPPALRQALEALLCVDQRRRGSVDAFAEYVHGGWCQDVAIIRQRYDALNKRLSVATQSTFV